MRCIAIVFAILQALIALGCASNSSASLAKQCEDGLSVAYRELDFARTKGLAGTVEYTKAAGLLSAAKIQFEFGKYPNCIDKVKRARAFIGKSQVGE